MLPQAPPITRKPAAHPRWLDPEMILERAFLQNRPWDYAACLFAGIVICWFSYLVDIHQTRLGFRGFLGKENLNWWSLPVLIPIILFLARKFWKVMIPPHSIGVPFLDPITSSDEKLAAYEHFRSKVLGHDTLYSIVLTAIAINLADIWDQPGRFYWAYWSSHVTKADLLAHLPANAKDWSVMFLLVGGPSAKANAFFVVLAYSMQFFAIILGLSFLVIAAKYNLAFLRMIYQRRYVDRGAYRPVVIDIEDQDCLFGFQRTNQVFTAQVALVFVAGIILLLSRIVNIDPLQSKSMEAVAEQIDSLLKFEFSRASLNPVVEAIFSGALFPDLGQLMIIIAWLAFFAIAMLPVTVKLLPAYPNPFKILDLITYLREFLPDGQWSLRRWEWGDNPDNDSVRVIREEVASRFAEQNFWPNGDRKARLTFFLAFTLFFLLCFPYLPSAGSVTGAILIYVLIGFLGWAASAVLFRVLRGYLDFIDPQLNRSPEKEHD